MASDPAYSKQYKDLAKERALESGKCLLKSCDVDMADDSMYCATHRDKERKRKAASERKTRNRRRRQRLCITCGGQRPRAQSECEACRLAKGRVPKRILDKTAEIAARAERLAAATRKHADGRTRYHGQQKKGNQPRIQLDGQDLGYARDMLERGETGLRWYEDPAVQVLPRIQKKDVMDEALHRLGQAIGHIEDVMRRRDRQFYTHFQQRHGIRAALDGQLEDDDETKDES